MKKCENINQCIENQYKNLLIKVNYRWCIGILIEIIVLILTYKFWDKREPLQTLISVGSGLISIVLGVFAIIYAMIESIKTNNKESKVEGILDQIEAEVDEMKNVVRAINVNTNTSLSELANIKKTNDKIIEQISNYNYEEFNKKVNEEEKSKIQTSSSELDSEVMVKSKKVILRIFKKGDICIANLGNERESEITGVRPVIIAQNSILNKYSPTLSVIPITALNSPNDNVPTHVQFNWRNQTNIAVVEQIITINKKNILDFTDTLDFETLQQIDKAIMIQLDIQGENL